MDDLIQRLRDAIDEKYPIRGHATGELLRDAVAALSAAEARVKELEGALPRTADGVVVNVGSKIWFDPDPDAYMVIDLVQIGDGWASLWCDSDEVYSSLDTSPAPIYSSAAAAARAEKEEERHG